MEIFFKQRSSSTIPDSVSDQITDFGTQLLAHQQQSLTTRLLMVCMESFSYKITMSYPKAERVYSVSKVYADANEKRPKEYWDYENFEIEWGLISNYEIVSKIGRGKYSEVFPRS
ncbi:unnamed protein product [Wickerhamomyces anomalus]